MLIPLKLPHDASHETQVLSKIDLVRGASAVEPNMPDKGLDMIIRD